MRVVAFYTHLFVIGGLENSNNPFHLGHLMWKTLGITDKRL